jgi:hypothetical protein
MKKKVIEVNHQRRRSSPRRRKFIDYWQSRSENDDSEAQYRSSHRDGHSILRCQRRWTNYFWLKDTRECCPESVSRDVSLLRTAACVCTRLRRGRVCTRLRNDATSPRLTCLAVSSTSDPSSPPATVDLGLCDTGSDGNAPASALEEAVVPAGEGIASSTPAPRVVPRHGWLGPGPLRHGLRRQRAGVRA